MFKSQIKIKIITGMIASQISGISVAQSWLLTCTRACVHLYANVLAAHDVHAAVSRGGLRGLPASNNQNESTARYRNLP